MLKTGDCVIHHPGVYTTGLAMVVSKLIIYIRQKSPLLILRVQYVTFVKHGFATGENASKTMLVLVPFKMLLALNVNVLFGTTAEEYSNVLFVILICAKMINLNIRHLVKFWNPKTTNVC